MSQEGKILSRKFSRITFQILNSSTKVNALKYGGLAQFEYNTTNEKKPNRDSDPKMETVLSQISKRNWARHI